MNSDSKQEKKAKLDTIDFFPVGMEIDNHAKLYRNNEFFFRGIHKEYSDFYLKLLSNKVIQNLISDNLIISTQKSTLAIDSFELVLEHPAISNVSYPFEWTTSMFKESAITILTLNIELMKHGLCTQDAHPWNVTFNGIKPIFIDFTSIIPLPDSGEWCALEEFQSYCVNTLLLMSKGYPTTARRLLREIFCYPDPLLIDSLLLDKDFSSNLSRLLTKKIRNKITKSKSRVPNKTKNFLKKIRHKLYSHYQNSYISNEKNNKGIKKLEALLEKIQRINVSPLCSEWSNYYSGANELPIYNGEIETVRSISQSTSKHRVIDSILSKINPKTLLDIGCNRGVYSQMASLKGTRVIGIDTDEYAIDKMYCDSKKMGSSALPLFVNAVAPAEAISFHLKPFPQVTERLRCDFVLCLGLVHHMVFKRTNMSFEHISQLLDAYSNKYLMVEFVPKEDKYVSDWYTEKFNWYNCENFMRELSKYFPSIEVYPSFPSPRLILFCQK